jgi:hypothetical protein
MTGHQPGVGFGSALATTGGGLMGFVVGGPLGAAAGAGVGTAASANYIWTTKTVAGADYLGEQLVAANERAQAEVAAVRNAMLSQLNKVTGNIGASVDSLFGDAKGVVGDAKGAVKETSTLAIYVLLLIGGGYLVTRAIKSPSVGGSRASG